MLVLCSAFEALTAVNVRCLADGHGRPAPGIHHPSCIIHSPTQSPTLRLPGDDRGYLGRSPGRRVTGAGQG